MSVASSEQPYLLEKRAFILKRLHSLSGIVPVGAFLGFHLVANFAIVFGPEAYNTVVSGIHLLEELHLLFVVEMVFIILPILFHGILGFVIWYSGMSNLRSYPNMSNACYVLQRVTGAIILAFILFHLFHMGWIGDKFFGEEEEETTEMALKVTSSMRDHAWVVPFYAIGILAAAFHMANGLRTALITWGVTITERSRILAIRFSLLVGVVLAGLGLASLAFFMWK